MKTNKPKKNEEIKLRVEAPMKAAISVEVLAEHSSESAIVRRAVIYYLDRERPGWREKSTKAAAQSDPGATDEEGEKDVEDENRRRRSAVKRIRTAKPSRKS